jgi:uncharacterized RDD family membrane protein YckC
VLVAGLLWNPLIVPVGVLLMGIVDGRFGTTPGKKLLQLRTLDGRGDPPGLKMGLLRMIVKSWGPMVLAASGDALPDSGPLGVAQGILFVAWLATSAAVFFGQRRALHDRLAGTRVVYDL